MLLGKPVLILIDKKLIRERKECCAHGSNVAPNDRFWKKFFDNAHIAFSSSSWYLNNMCTQICRFFYNVCLRILLS